jgi:menaquinone-dependent protoporphyrinogen oxidase
VRDVKVLIVYATTEGQTRKVARFVADAIEEARHSCVLIDAADVEAGFQLPDADAAIIAGSVHLGRYQSALAHLVTTNQRGLADMPSAFLSISLAAAGDEADREDVAECVKRFAEETGWVPGLVEHVAGAFRYTSYDFFKRWAMKYIALRKGSPTDTSRDYELTDWQALARFVQGFLLQVDGWPAPPAAPGPR